MERRKIKETELSVNITSKPLFVKIPYALVIGGSCSALCIICNSRSYLPKQVLTSLVASFIVGILIACFQFWSNDIIILNWKYVCAILTALYLLRWLVTYTNRDTIQYFCDSLNYRVGWGPTNTTILGVILFLSIPCSVLIVRKTIHLIYVSLNRFYKSLDTAEKKYYIVVCSVGLVITAICFITTTAFWMPTLQDGTLVKWDVIYTTDTGTLVYWDSFANIGHGQNDIRQPLFAVFAMPFALVAHFISEFIPLITISRAYGFALCILQIIVVATIGVLITRMLKINGTNKSYYLLMYALCFPNIIFAEVLEQYAITSLYVVLCLYVWVFGKKEKCNLLTVAATGTLLTSGILFPFCTKTRSISAWIRNLGKVIVFGLVVTIISGQLPMLIDIKKQITDLLDSFGGISKPLFERICQYTEFIKSIFWASPGEIVDIGHQAYVLPSCTSISVIGVILLCIVIAGWIINRKKVYANICMFWVLFSQLILVVIGWGSSENGMILYSLYFAWAYISLVFCFIERLVKHKKALILLCTLVLLIWNAKELINILFFAHSYYPVW